MARKKKSIRRFTDDVLSKEARSSIKKMARTVSEEIYLKIVLANKRMN